MRKIKILKKEEGRKLRNKYGDKNVNNMMKAIMAAGPSTEALMKVAGDMDQLLKMEVPEEVVTRTTQFVDTMLDDNLDKLIADITIGRIAIILMKRNEEFLNQFTTTCKKLSEISPLLFVGMLSDNTFKELLCFSPQGIDEWLEDGISKFGDSTAGIAELYRYITMCPGYDDISKYRISDESIFLEEMYHKLTIFARQKFDMWLLAAKSKSHVPHVTEDDTVHIFLPDYIDYFDDKERNTVGYFMTTLHEASHLYKGTFKLEISEITDLLKEKGATVKSVRYKSSNDKRVKTLMLDKDGKEYIATSLFHIFQLVSDPRHGNLIKTLWNLLEDSRIDRSWITEKAPGYQKTERENTMEFLKKHRHIPEEFNVSETVEGMLQVCCLLSSADEPKGFIEALKSGNVPEGPDREAVLHLLSMNSEVLDFVLGGSDTLVELNQNRDDHGTSSFIATTRYYDRMIRLIEENPEFDNIEESNNGGGGNLEGMSGPLSLTDFDPENTELSFDPSKGIDADDLPEDIREKIKKKIGEAFENMCDEEKENLAKEAEARMSAESDKKGKPSNQNEIHGRWDLELVDGIEIKKYCDVKVVKPEEGESDADLRVAGNIRIAASRIFVRKLLENPGAMHGQVDPREKRQWRRLRRKGIIAPRNYHTELIEKKARSIAIMVVGDASGSTGGMINGRRKIDYIRSSVHTLISGLGGIPEILTAYGFFNSYGRDNIHLYLGKDFSDPVRYAGTEPGNSNRDGAVIRKTGEMLSRQKVAVKIALFVTDSMPADGDYYAGIRGVEDVRHAMTELKRAAIVPFTISVPPDEHYYNNHFSDVKEYLDYLYLGSKNYWIINSEKELDRAFSAFLRANLPKLKRTSYI